MARLTVALVLGLLVFAGLTVGALHPEWTYAEMLAHYWWLVLLALVACAVLVTPEGPRHA